MPDIRFTDGMTINTDGPYRVIRKKDGLYVVGHGFMSAVDDDKEAEELLRSLKEKKEHGM